MAYNPYAYVPGGSTLKKATQIQNKGYGLPLNYQGPAPVAPVAPTQTPISGQAAVDYYTGLAHATPEWVTGNVDIQGQRDRSTLTAAEQIRQQLASFGIIPDEFKDTYGWVNPETRQLAQQNTAAGTSTFARLQQAFADAALKSKRTLAARGAARSGENAYSIQQNALAQRQQYADAVGQLLNANRGVYNQYTSEFDAQAAAWRDLASKAYDAVDEMPLPNVAPVVRPPAPPYNPVTSPYAAGAGSRMNIPV